MKSIYTIVCMLISATVLLSCSKEDEGDPAPGLISAELFDDTSVMENSATLEFRIPFNKPATTNGYFTVGVTSTEDAVFETIPAVQNGEIEFQVAKGQSFATLRFSPQNNQVLQANKSVSFELLDSSENIMFGTKRTTTIQITEDEAAVSASFYSGSVTAIENHAEGVEIRIELTAPAPGDGNLLLQLEGDNEAYFVDTYPALDAERKLNIAIPSGTLWTSFQVYPKNNTLLQNHKTLKFQMVEATGVVLKGNTAEVEVLLIDDEIQGKLKSVETMTDNKTIRKTWEYGTDGKVSTLVVQQQSSQLSTVHYNYHYSQDGRLEQISTFPGDGEFYFWENGKIVRSEKTSGFFKVAESRYEYDTAGRIQRKTVFSYADNSEYVASEAYEYEYFADGNLKKESKYLRGNQSNWILTSSLAYHTYSDKENPAPMEIIPTVKIQQHLPMFYLIMENGAEFSSYYAYHYNPDGKLTARTTSGETTTYTYY